MAKYVQIKKEDLNTLISLGEDFMDTAMASYYGSDACLQENSKFFKELVSSIKESMHGKAQR